METVEFKVTEIIDADTIKVSPKWRLTRSRNGEFFTGDNIRISGYRMPVKGSMEFEETVETLKQILLGKAIVLKQPALLPQNETTNTIIHCRVFLNGVDIAEYFPELKIRKPGFRN